MILEQLIFTILAFGIFVYMFLKMFKENDTNYIGILIVEAIGISLNFVEVLKKIEFGPFFTIIKYILAILIPIAMKGVKYRPMKSEMLLLRNVLIFGVGGVITPFIGIKIINIIITPLCRMLGIM